MKQLKCSSEYFTMLFDICILDYNKFNLKIYVFYFAIQPVRIIFGDFQLSSQISLGKNAVDYQATLAPKQVKVNIFMRDTGVVILLLVISLTSHMPLGHWVAFQRAERVNLLFSCQTHFGGNQLPAIVHFVENVLVNYFGRIRIDLFTHFFGTPPLVHQYAHAASSTIEQTHKSFTYQ